MATERETACADGGIVAHQGRFNWRYAPSDAPHHRRRLYGRLAAMFFMGSGVLGLAALLVPASGLNVTGAAELSAVAFALGVAAWVAPWDRWPRQASLGLVPPAFVLLGVANAYRAADPQTSGLFFMVTFVWLGMAHPPRISVAMAPLAALAYLLPLLALHENAGTRTYSTALIIPLCVLVGEGVAWTAARQEKIELALRQEKNRTERLRELDEMKDKFLSSVSHELRNPITVCRGHLDVLGEDAGKRELRAVKETLINELDLMARLVEDLITLARVDDRAQLRMESLPLDGFVNGIVDRAETLLGDRLRVESEVTGQTLRADPQRLTQALLNLFRNAEEHARGERPVLFRIQAEPSSWRFEVADEGGGLAPGDEQIVFEPFRTGSSGNGGTGLGLSIVRGIAGAHGGQAGVINRPGRGATFWIRIPR